MLVIDYPLIDAGVDRDRRADPLGFTRAALVKAICDEYAHVYDAEEGTAATKTIPLEERGDAAQPQPHRRRLRHLGPRPPGSRGHRRALVPRTPTARVRIELHVES